MKLFWSFAFILIFPCYGIAQDSLKVYIFLSEKCPICQSVTIELKQLYAAYTGKAVSFIGLFPNEGLSTDKTIKSFGKKYGIPFLLKVDKGKQKVQELQATVTPQVFVVNKGKVLYSGKIDNSFESIGKRRSVVTEHYLKNALDQILQNKNPAPALTKPVGCFIM